jgi:hypothetical protein
VQLGRPWPGGVGSVPVQSACVEARRMSPDCSLVVVDAHRTGQHGAWVPGGTEGLSALVATLSKVAAWRTAASSPQPDGLMSR